MASLLIIEHPKTGERYAVSTSDFHKTYEPQGFKPVKYEDGREYEAPKRKNDKDSA